MPRATLVALALLLAAPLAGAQTPPPPSPSPEAPAAPAAPAPPTAPAAPAAPAEAAAPAPPTAPAAPAVPAPAPTAQTMVALVDAAPIGVDPAAATFVTDVLRQSLSQLGFGAVPTPQLYDVARRLQLPFPVPADGLATLMRLLDTPIGVTAEVRAGSGFYFVTLRTRFLAEPAERMRQVVATQWTLGDQIRVAVPALLAPPGSPGAVQPGAPLMPALPDMTNVQPPPRVRLPRIHPQRFELAGGLEVAIGPGQDSFTNFLAYARGAYFPADRFGLTASLAYANLRGRRGRVSNVLPMVGVETGVDLLARQHVYLPLRAEIGYLPFNGVVLRGTAGIAFSVARAVRIEVDILSPTVWFIPGTAALSLDLGAQVIYGVGEPPRRRRRRRAPAAESTPAAAPATESAPAAAGED